MLAIVLETGSASSVASEKKRRLMIRGIPSNVWLALEAMAARNTRSLEAEARFALQNAAWPLLVEQERRERAKGLAARLYNSLDALNRRRADSGLPGLRYSHLADMMDETYTEPVERWFAGTAEPSLQQVRALAEVLMVDAAWLRHGEAPESPQ